MKFHIYLIGVVVTLILAIIGEIISHFTAKKKNHTENIWYDVICILLLMSISWGGAAFLMLGILAKCLQPKEVDSEEKSNKYNFPKLD